MQAAGSSRAAALAAGYDLVFLVAAGLGLVIAVVSVLLPQARGAARRAGRPVHCRPARDCSHRHGRGPDPVKPSLPGPGGLSPGDKAW